jgi:predicted ribosomally synthesized peptide with nif11-like leader
MSIQAAQAFRQEVNQNPELQALVGTHIQAGGINAEALAALAREHGHDVSTDDVIATLSAANDELSDFEMDLVAGGTTSGTWGHRGEIFK